MDISISGDKNSASRRLRRAVLGERLSRLLNSPILFIALLLATVALGAKWYQLEASLRAPSIPGWSWSQHPNSLLVYYPQTDCGCGPGAATVLKQAQTHHLEAIVVTDVQGDRLNILSENISATHGDLITQQKLMTIQDWKKTGNIVVARVRRGRIIGRANGTNLSDSFFR